MTGPGIAVTAGSLTIDWTVENNGPGTTDSNYWYDDVWMSTHTTLGSGGTDVYLGTVQHTNPLAAGHQLHGLRHVHAAAGHGRRELLLHRRHGSAGRTTLGHDNQGVDLVYETNSRTTKLARARRRRSRSPRLPDSDRLERDGPEPRRQAGASSRSAGR